MARYKRFEGEPIEDFSLRVNEEGIEDEGKNLYGDMPKRGEDETIESYSNRLQNWKLAKQDKLYKLDKKRESFGKLRKNM